MSARQQVVAVVEDDPAMLKSLGRLLAASGYATEPFASGEAFLAGAASSEASCLVVDIHLGGINGIEMYRQLMALGTRLPVIFMTAVHDEATHKQAKGVGCIAYLRKPFRAHLLIDAIHEVIG